MSTTRRIEPTEVQPRLDLIPQLADLFSLLGDTSRLRIVSQCLHQYVNVSQLAAETELSQPLVSHHLRLLKAARMVVAQRRGKQMFYRAADHHVQCVINAMLEHMLEDGSMVDVSPSDSGSKVIKEDINV